MKFRDLDAFAKIHPKLADLVETSRNAFVMKMGQRIVDRLDITRGHIQALKKIHEEAELLEVNPMPRRGSPFLATVRITDVVKNTRGEEVFTFVGRDSSDGWRGRLRCTDDASHETLFEELRECEGAKFELVVVVTGKVSWLSGDGQYCTVTGDYVLAGLPPSVTGAGKGDPVAGYEEGLAGLGVSAVEAAKAARALDKFAGKAAAEGAALSAEFEEDAAFEALSEREQLADADGDWKSRMKTLW